MKGDDGAVYVGTRAPNGPRIEIEEGGERRPLRPRAFPSVGFEWGYRGRGPAETARAILWDALGSQAAAEWRRFKWEVVSKLPREGFRLERAAVRAWARGSPTVQGQRSGARR